MKKTLSVLVLLVLGLVGLKAQTPQFSNGGLGTFTSSNAFPLSSTTSTRVQWLHRPADFGAQITPGLITKIYLGSLSTVSSTTFTNLTVSIGETSIDTVTPTFITGLTQAYQAPSTVFNNITSGGWIEITLQTPIFYSGIQNLFVDVSQSGYTSGISMAQNSSTGPRRIWGNNAAATGAGTGLVRFGFDLLPNQAQHDAGISSILQPLNFCPNTFNNVNVRLRNYGKTPLTSVNINWTLNGLAQNPFFFTGYLDTLLGSGPKDTVLTLGNILFTGTNPYTISAWTTLPNGFADTVFFNDTAYRVVAPALAGTITVGTGAGFNYASLADMAAAMSAGGVCGPVLVNIDSASGPYFGQVNFNNIVGANATNTVTINGNGAVISAAPTTTNKAVISLSNADYFTFDRLRLVGTDINNGFGFHLRNGSDFVTIQNCDINLSAITSTSTLNSAGIVSSSSTAGTTDDGNNANFLTIQNNTIRGGASGGPFYGIYLNGSGSSGVTATNCKILNNNLVDFYGQGILLDKTDSCLVFGNSISKPTINTTTSTTFYGVYCFGANTAGVRIERNSIHSPFSGYPSSTSVAYGIWIGNDAVAAAPTLVANNVIYNINSTGTVYGLYNGSADHCRMVYNTVNLNVLPSSGITRGFYQLTTATGISFLNNIISVTRGGSGAAHCIYLGTTTSTVTSNNNLYFTANGASVGFFTSSFATLANWQTANSNAYDQNSVFTDPSFVGAGPLLIPNAGLGNNIAIPQSDVSTDFLGNPRNATNPDPGAFEFTPAPNDAGAIAIHPVAFCPGNTPLFVRVRNFGTANLTSVQATLVINGLTAGSGTFIGSLATGQDTLVSVGSYNFLNNTNYNIIAYTSLPNGVPDITNLNDTTSRLNVQAALSGIVTIGGAGADFATLGSLGSIIASSSLCGPLEIQITGNTVETTGLILPTIPGNFPITIKPVGGVRTISGSVAGALIRLNGTDQVTIDGNIGGVRSLIINNTNSSANSAGIFVSSQGPANGCERVAIRNVEIQGGSNVTTSTFGIIAGGTAISTTSQGDNNDFLLIENNLVRNSYFGIFTRGTIGGLLDSLIIRNNSVGDTLLANSVTFKGIDVQNSTGGLITGNLIRNMELTTFVSIAAIEVGGSGNGNAISRNRIIGVRQLSTSGYGAYGINLIGGSNHLVVNNMISGVHTLNYSTTSTTFNGFGIRITSGTAHQIYYNSVNMYGNYSNTTASGASNAAFCITSTVVTGIDVRNNIFANKTVSSNTTGAVNFMSVWLPSGYTFGTSNFNHNAYFIPSSSIQHFIGKVGLTAGAGNSVDLNAWRLVTQVGNPLNDVNSQPGNNGSPLFVSDDSLDFASGTLTPAESGGSPIASLGTPNIDFRGISRPAGTGSAPDIGALEFSGLLGDFAGPVIDTVFFSPTGSQCIGTARTVTVQVTDLTGIDTVQIIYTVNAGAPIVAQMTLSGLNTYAGTIPVLGSSLISFRVRAVDSSPLANFSISTSRQYQDEIIGDGLAASTTTPTINVGDSARLSVFSPLLGQLKITEIVMFRTGTGATNPYPAYIPTGPDDFVEISNLSTGSVNLSGFVFEIYGSGARPPYTFPSSAIIPAGSVLVLHLGTGTDNPSNLYFTTGGSSNAISSGGATGIVLKNSTGVVIDAVAFNGYTFTAITGVTSANWNGPGAPSPSGNAGSQLLGADQNSSANWSGTAVTPGTLGTFNTGLVTSNPLSVSWFYNGVNIGSSASLTTNPILIAGQNAFIVVVSDSLCSASDTVIVNVVIPSGVSVHFSSSKVIFYPNPAREDVLISLPHEFIGNPGITLTDLSGKLHTPVYTLAPNNKEIKLDLRRLASGLYVVKILVDEEVYTIKIAKE